MAQKAFNAVNGLSVGDDELLNVIDSGGNVTAQTLTVSIEANLGSIDNLLITGGESGQFLQTDGSGSLTFALPDPSNSIENGSSNVVIDANSDVRVSVAGTSNVLVVTSTGANLTGNLGISGSASIGGGNLSDANVITANTIIAALSANLGNSVVANFFIGDGGLLINISGAGTGNKNENGTSNVLVYESSNITVSVAGTENVATFTSSSFEVIGNIVSSGNIGVNNQAYTAQLTLDNNLGPKIDFYYDQSGDGDRYGIELQSSLLKIYSGGGSLASPDGGIAFGKSNTSTFTESMRIQNNGNVGIGTSSPGSFVTIEKNAGGDYLDLTVRNLSTDNDAENQARIRLSTAGDAVEGVVFGKTYNGGPYSGFAYLWNTENTPLVLSTNNAERIRILTDGNVGIGTSIPGSTLEVNGSFAATDKSFVIKHPSKEGMKLRYGSLESPYHGVRLTGEGEIANGKAVITLPDYISSLVQEQGINIQLTNIKHDKVLYVDKVDLENNQFVIKGPKSLLGKKFRFYWSFTAIRKDIPNLTTEYKET